MIHNFSGKATSKCIWYWCKKKVERCQNILWNNNIKSYNILCTEPDPWNKLFSMFYTTKQTVGWILSHEWRQKARLMLFFCFKTNIFHGEKLITMQKFTEFFESLF